MGKPFYLLTARPLPTLLSIVIPIYNEEEVLPLLRARLDQLSEGFPCRVEYVLVNDGSSDESLRLLRDIAMSDPKYRVLSLARNFGHQAAATAGLDAARGNAVVLMDADLQDPPELIHQMLAHYQEGYDVVYAQRAERDGESFFKKWSAWLFYRIMQNMVYKDLPPDVGDYRLVSRRCLETLKQMRELHRFLRGMVSWVGYPQIAVPFRRAARAAGETKYPLRKMLAFAWTAAVSFSPIPLRLSFILGSAIFAVGAMIGLVGLWKYFTGQFLVRGWTSLLIVTCLSSGSILITLGILGEYVARIYEEIKGRPIYIVSDKIELTETE